MTALDAVRMAYAVTVLSVFALMLGCALFVRVRDFRSGRYKDNPQ